MALILVFNKMKRIKWTYTHHLNSTSSIRRVKIGEYFGKIKHTYKHWDKPGAVQMAFVKFDDNEGYSKVPYDELEFIVKIKKKGGE